MGKAPRNRKQYITVSSDVFSSTFPHGKGIVTHESERFYIQWAVQDSNSHALSTGKLYPASTGDAVSDADTAVLAEIIVRWKKLTVQSTARILAIIRSVNEQHSD
jgi:hypothetical protein